MRKSLFLQLTIISITGVFALQPNHVKTIKYNVDGKGSNIESVEYTDGLGRKIQNKLRMKPDSLSPKLKDIVTCTLFDKYGRHEFSSKAFVDDKRGGEYLSAEIIDNNRVDNEFEQLLYNQYADQNAFSKTKYWDDPLRQMRGIYGPGDSSIYGIVKSWNLGVSVDAKNTFFVISDSVNIGTVDFENGMIKQISSSSSSILLSDVLDGLYYQFLRNNPFLIPGVSEPKYLLSITMANDNKISQELKDIFGKTIRTLSGPDTNGITAPKLIANYSFDINGNLLKEIPPYSTSNDEQIFYLYNTAGQLKYKKTPDSGEFEYFYRADGQLDYVLSYTDTTLKWDRKIIYEYDEIGRLLTVIVESPIYGSSSMERKNVAYFLYDDIDQIKTRAIFSQITDSHYKQLTNFHGRLVARIAINFPGSEKQTDIGEVFSYDEEGRINRKYRIMGGSPLLQETVYSYDIHGQMIDEYFYYSGDHIRKRYEYDGLGRLAKIYNGKLQPDNSYLEKELVQFIYNSIGQMQKKILSAIDGDSPYQLNYEYDIRDRLKGLQFPSERYGYSEMVNYDKSGNISDLQNNYVFNQAGTIITQPYIMNYYYDDLNRLKTVNCSDTNFNSQYLYDGTGKLMSKREGPSNIIGYNYYPYTNRLEKTNKNSSDIKSYVYSKNGNLIVDFTKNMIIEYDWRDLPCIFRFYDDLSSVEISVDTKGTYNGPDLYLYIKSFTSINLLSTVMMIYDADGNRVAKMDMKE